MSASNIIIAICFFVLGVLAYRYHKRVFIKQGFDEGWYRGYAAGWNDGVEGTSIRMNNRKSKDLAERKH